MGRIMRWAAAACLAIALGMLFTAGAGWHSQPVSAQADGLGSHITETGPSWTGKWTRQPGTNTWDATYSGGTGKPTTMTVTRSGNALTATRTFSADGNLCTYSGTIQGDGRTVTGRATCNSGQFDFTLTLDDVAPATSAGSATARVWAVDAAGATDPPQYHLQDNIQVCFSQSATGATVLTDITADGNSAVIYQFGGSAQSVCLDWSVVAGPPGRECIRMDFTNAETGGQSTVQTCFQVVL